MQKILDKNRKVFNTVRAKSEQIRAEYQNDLAGMVFCADCGRPSTSNADRWICDFYDTAGGRRRGSTSGTGGSNASAGMVHIRCQTRIARLWNCLNKSNALIVERISIFSTMRVFHSAGM